MYSLAQIFVGQFRGKYVLLHVIAILVTYFCVVFGIDWLYFLFMSQFMPKYVLFAADISGFLVPILLPLGLVVWGRKRTNPIVVETGYVLARAVIVAFVTSMTYKAFTGRISPPLREPFLDVSNQFNFGFMQHSIVGGWPSSHATVVFAIAACLTVLFPRSYRIQIAAYLFALFVGLSETIGFHWVSEFLAGALIGTAIGSVAGTIARKEK